MGFSLLATERRSGCLLLPKLILERQVLKERKGVYFQVPAIWKRGCLHHKAHLPGKMGDSCLKSHLLGKMGNSHLKAHLHLSVEAEVCVSGEKGTEKKSREGVAISLSADEHSPF